MQIQEGSLPILVQNHWPEGSVHISERMQLNTGLLCGLLHKEKLSYGFMGYVKQATSLHEDCGLAHRKLVDLGYIKIMTDTVKKFETVPKQHEMISNSIFH